MKKTPTKLTLNQETLRHLTHEDNTTNFNATNHSCVRSVCGLACTPAAVMN